MTSLSNVLTSIELLPYEEQQIVVEAVRNRLELEKVRRALGGGRVGTQQGQLFLLLLVGMMTGPGKLATQAADLVVKLAKQALQEPTDLALTASLVGPLVNATRLLDAAVELLRTALRLAGANVDVYSLQSAAAMEDIRHLRTEEHTVWWHDDGFGEDHWCEGGTYTTEKVEVVDCSDVRKLAGEALKDRVPVGTPQ